MVYLAGIDGGASKTHCVIGNADGLILSEGCSAGSNYQVHGEEAARLEIESAMKQAAGSLGIDIGDISYTVLGLAGADTDLDFKVLNGICGKFLQTGKYRILNDAWIGLRAGIPENYGIVTVCGTGAACAGRNKRGEEAILRNLCYELGNIGGGGDIARMALHYAFRSEEGTGPRTDLEKEIPKLFGLKNICLLAEHLRSGKPDTKIIYEIPILVCRLAVEGDTVSQDILLRIGNEAGKIAGGVIKKLGMERKKFNITLVGSVFSSDCPLLIDEYTTTVHRTAPFSKIAVCRRKPAVGAYHIAMDEYKTLF